MSRPVHGWGWIPPFALLLAAIVAVPLRMLDNNGLPRYSALRSELHEVRKRNSRMRWEVRELKKTVDKLRHDPRAVESIARDELQMLHDGEIVFQFPR